MCMKEEYNRMLIGNVLGIKETEGQSVNEMLGTRLKGLVGLGNKFYKVSN